MLVNEHVLFHIWDMDGVLYRAILISDPDGIEIPPYPGRWGSAFRHAEKIVKDFIIANYDHEDDDETLTYTEDKLYDFHTENLADIQLLLIEHLMQR